MPKNNLVYLGHMLDCAKDIQAYLRGKGRDDFDADPLLRLATAHLIQTIGEAARLVAPDFQLQHAQIPWTSIIGMRHRIVHDYLNIDFDVVWDVATRDLPVLIPQIEAILAQP